MTFISFNTFIHDLFGAGPLLKFTAELVLRDFNLNARVDGATFSILDITENAFGLIDACFSFRSRC